MNAAAINGAGTALLGFALCGGGCATLLWLLLRSGLAWRLAIDAPNARSLHTRPTPRVGGVALTPVCLAWAWGAQLLPAAILAPAFALAVVSFVDDRGHVPVAVRLACQFGCAAAVLLWPAPALGEVGIGIGIGIAVALVWMANLYNFMDGSDGLAGAMTLLGFGAYAIAALLAGDPKLAAAVAGCAGAAAGFLLFNWPPARLFLGDIGSVPLGFLAGALGFTGWQRAAWPAWFPVLVFAPFIADASLTLVARLARGERVWQAHREHTYQRMVAHGYGHRGTLLRWIGLMLATAGSGLALLRAAEGTVAAGLVAWGAILAGGFLVGTRVWPRAASA